MAEGDNPSLSSQRFNWARRCRLPGPDRYRRAGAGVTFRMVWCLFLAFLGLTWLSLDAGAQDASTQPPAVVAVRSRLVSQRLSAYATVVPITVTRLRAIEAGTIHGLEVVPGETVAADAILGRLAGPEIAARLSRRRAAVAEAEAAERAAQRSLAIERQKLAAHLATRQSVYQTEAALAQAQAQRSAAEAGLQAVESSFLLRAPTAGTVVSLAVADGEHVTAGQTLLTLQSKDRLWLRALYYGAAAGTVRIGMRGRFVPADGAAPIPVEVASILPVLRPDGGLPVGLRPSAPPANWVSGEAGTVTLIGARHLAVAVPTRALILDRGRWWVLIHTAQGDRRQAVTPGASRGSETLIDGGLTAGTEIVVGDAYRSFHRDFSRRYQPPD